MKEKIMNYQANFCTTGYLDIKSAIETANAVNLNEDQLFDLVEEFANECDLPLNKVDPCAVIYGHILQQARNIIEDLLDIDIQSYMDINVYGNYLDSSYDASESDINELQRLVTEADDEIKKQLADNDFVSHLFNYFSIDIG